MDTKGYEELTKNVSPEVRQATGQYLQGEIEAYMAGKKAFVDYHLDEVAFKAVVELLSLQTIDTSRIRGIRVHNHATGHEVHEDSLAQLRLSGEWSFDSLIETLADSQGIWADDPNNFEVTFVSDLDTETVVALGVRQYEGNYICDDCYESAEVEDIGVYSSSENGCGHIPQTYTRQYWLSLMHISELEQRTGWRNWDVHILHELDIPEIPKKLEDGILRLDQLERGDSFRFVTEGRQSQYDSGLSQKFTYDAVVLESNGQPLCSVIATHEDGTQTRYQDVFITGSGRETTRNQNPVQKQEEAFTNNWGYLSTGTYVLFRKIPSDRETPDDMFIQLKTPIVHIELLDSLSIEIPRQTTTVDVQ